MKIIIEGKQGEGKSRLASHVMAALAQMGFSMTLWDNDGTADPVMSGPLMNEKYAHIYVRNT